MSKSYQGDDDHHEDTIEADIAAQPDMVAGAKTADLVRGAFFDGDEG